LAGIYRDPRFAFFDQKGVVKIVGDLHCPIPTSILGFCERASILGCTDGDLENGKGPVEGPITHFGSGGAVALAPAGLSYVGQLCWPRSVQFRQHGLGPA
jgi:hypothetical protein